jgi:hypothetical protein
MARAADVIGGAWRIFIGSTGGVRQLPQNSNFNNCCGILAYPCSATQQAPRLVPHLSSKAESRLAARHSAMSFAGAMLRGVPRADRDVPCSKAQVMLYFPNTAAPDAGR